MKLTSAFVVALLAAPAMAADPPEYVKRAGNVALKAVIEDQIRPIYDKAGPWIFTLSKENLSGIPRALGTELNGAKMDGKFSRLYVGTWTSQGKYSAEVYLLDGHVAFKYETFEYFAGASPKGEWKNFKNIASWERRTYIADGTVAYAESKGKSAPELERSAAGVETQARRWIQRLELEGPAE